MAMELNKLFRSLELKTGNPDEKIEGYLIAIAGATQHALQTTVARIIRGEIDGISKKFCPQPPELASAIRDEMDFVCKQVEVAAKRMQIVDHRVVAVPHKNLWQRQEEARARMADEGRALMFKVDSHAGFMARKSEMQKGWVYSAITGEIYGAPGSARAAPPVPEPAADEIPW